MARIRPRDLILCCAIGLGGAIYGVNKLVTILAGTAALCALIGPEYLWRRLRASRAAKDAAPPAAP